MSCPHKWTSRIDENDQGSSWESEPEGEKRGELASLEAPDDEGEWCWPKRNRINRWRTPTEKSRRLVTEPFGPMTRGRSPVNMEEIHRCGRLWISAERNAEERVPRDIHRGSGEVQERKKG